MIWYLVRSGSLLSTVTPETVTWNCIHLFYLTWEVEDKYHRQGEQVQVDNNFLLHPNPFYYAIPHFFYYALPHLNMPDTTQQYSTLFSIGKNYTTTTSRTPIPLQPCPRCCSKIFHSFAQSCTASHSLGKYSTALHSLAQPCICILHGLAYFCKSESYLKTIKYNIQSTWQHFRARHNLYNSEHVSFTTL